MAPVRSAMARPADASVGAVVGGVADVAVVGCGGVAQTGVDACGAGSRKPGGIEPHRGFRPAASLLREITKDAGGVDQRSRRRARERAGEDHLRVLDRARRKILVAHAVHGPRERERVVHGRSAGAGVAALAGERRMRDNAGCHRADDGHRIAQKTTPGKLAHAQASRAPIRPVLTLRQTRAARCPAAPRYRRIPSSRTAVRRRRSDRDHPCCRRSP